jgi:hypothetical protein
LAKRLASRCLFFCAGGLSAQGLSMPGSIVNYSAYFFMAANAKGMDKFNSYFVGGEYAYNGAVKPVGRDIALSKFNDAAGKLAI